MLVAKANNRNNRTNNANRSSNFINLLTKPFDTNSLIRWVKYFQIVDRRFVMFMALSQLLDAVVQTLIENVFRKYFISRSCIVDMAHNCGDVIFVVPPAVNQNGPLSNAFTSFFI